jgi:hypothetical protein
MPSSSTPPLAPLSDSKPLFRTVRVPTTLERESKQKAVLENDLGHVRAGAVEKEGVSGYNMQDGFTRDSRGQLVYDEAENPASRRIARRREGKVRSSRGA